METDIDNLEDSLNNSPPPNKLYLLLSALDVLNVYSPNDNAVFGDDDDDATATPQVVQRRRVCRSCRKTKLLSKYPPSINNSNHHCSKCLLLCDSCGSPLITDNNIQRCSHINCIANTRTQRWAQINYSQKHNKYLEFKKSIETFNPILQLFGQHMYNAFTFKSKNIIITPNPVFSDDDIAQIRNWITNVNPEGIHEPINFDIKGKRRKKTFKLR